MPGPSGATTPLALPYPTPDDNVDVPRDIKALADAIAGAGGAPGLIYVGEVRWMAILAGPAGWVACDGAAYSRTGLARLFAAIGTTYGTGDGTTTFNVPDLRGRAPVGTGAGPGLTARSAGTKWGVEAVLLTAAQSGLPNHDHPIWSPPQNVQPDTGYGFPRMVGGGGIGSGYNLLAESRGPQAAAQSHDNTQPSLAIPAYIFAGE